MGDNGAPAWSPVNTDPTALLSRTERFWYRVGDVFARQLVPVAVLWNYLCMVNIVRLVAMRRIDLVGQEHLDALGPDDRLVLVCNHRSFFDYFVVGALMYTRTRTSRRVMFPVRAPFFYETLLGGAINGVLAGFTMFPPILRDGKRGGWNKFAADRMIEALNAGPMWIGYHPEGKRGAGPDPYALLPAHAGVGRVVLDGPPSVKVVPVFVIGITNGFIEELRRNWLDAVAHPIGVCFGAPVPVDDLRGEDQARAHVAIAERAMDAIRALAEAHRARAGAAPAGALAASP